MSPHRPVQLKFADTDFFLVPVLTKPQRLPVQAPFRPALEPRQWHQSESAIEFAEALIADAAQPLSQSQKQAILDMTYFTVVQDMEQSLSDITDTPLRHSSRPRASPPVIKWVKAKQRDITLRTSWKSLEAPL